MSGADTSGSGVVVSGFGALILAILCLFLVPYGGFLFWDCGIATPFNAPFMDALSWNVNHYFSIYMQHFEAKAFVPWILRFHCHIVH